MVLPSWRRDRMSCCCWHSGACQDAAVVIDTVDVVADS